MKQNNLNYKKQNIRYKQNIPVTFIKNKQNKKSLSKINQNQNSIDSPIKALKLSRQSKQSQNQQPISNVIQGLIETTNSAKMINNQRYRFNKDFKSNKGKIITSNNKQISNNKSKSNNHNENSSYQSYQDFQSNQKQNQIKQKNISKIQLGKQQIIELPVQKASSNDDQQQFQSYIQEISSEKSEPYQPRSDIQTPKQIFLQSKQLTNPQEESKNKPLKKVQFQTKPKQVPTNRINSQKFEIKHSRSITDSLLSPQFQKYIGQSRFLHKSRQANPLHCLKHYHHNQYPHATQSQTFSRCQNAHYRTTFIKQQLQLTLANNLDKISFLYTGAHSRILYNNKLKIKNDSPVNIDVKIMCTSPSHYEVRPFSDATLCPSQIMNVMIQLKLKAHDINHLTMKHDMYRYKGDKFKIVYEASQYCPQIVYQQGEKILPLVIQQTQQQRIRNHDIIQGQQSQKQKIIQGEKNICMYKDMLNKTKKKIQLLDYQIKMINSIGVYTKYFTKNLIYFVMMIGFVIGLWLG